MEFISLEAYMSWKTLSATVQTEFDFFKKLFTFY